ncbi:MAG: hypothetical protein CFE31_05675 [Rhizobiales bacterium PAR1]|nr:MAG: hypothetical protein CFE31_05675 [Rhizobiales bacterium PAR1]
MKARIHRQSGVLKAECAVITAKALMRTVFAGLRPLTAALLLASFALLAPASAQGFRMSEEIVADPNTGAALLGFDPVAYFIEQKAIPGRRSIQASYAGKAWYFVSDANRTEFLSNPTNYLPAFGGHDPVAIAAGFVLAGSPEFFAIAGQRVYLFRHPESRDAFLQDPEIGTTAESQWPQVKRHLVP